MIMATTPEYAGYHPESSGVNFFTNRLHATTASQRIGISFSESMGISSPPLKMELAKMRVSEQKDRLAFVGG